MKPNGIVMSIPNGTYTFTDIGSGFSIRPEATHPTSGLVVDADDGSDIFKVRTFHHAIIQDSRR